MMRDRTKRIERAIDIDRTNIVERAKSLNRTI